MDDTSRPNAVSKRTLLTILGRLAFIGGGLLVGLVLIETALRVLATVAPHVLARARPPATDDGIHVLCVGDSHTYGVLVPPDRAYPEQLERHLRRAGIAATVYNLGLPGQSTRQVLDRLPRQLATYRPHLVIVWAGINNYWNLKGRENDPEASVRSGFGWNDLRLVRFAHLLREGLLSDAAFERRRPAARPLEGAYARISRWRIEGPGSEEVVDIPIDRADLDATVTGRLTREDLTAIARLARERGVRLAFLAYPFPLRPNTIAVNEAITAVGASEQVAVVRTEIAAQHLGLRGHKDRAFRDLHPKAILYRAIAWEAARQLVRERLVPRPPRPARDAAPG